MAWTEIPATPDEALANEREAMRLWLAAREPEAWGREIRAHTTGRTGMPPSSPPTRPLSDTVQDDYDSPWKEALDGSFPAFLALLFPVIHAAIDWSRGFGFLDKELQQVARDTEIGRRYADKLVTVYTRDAAETSVLIHVEVQGETEPGFERLHDTIPTTKTLTATPSG